MSSTPINAETTAVKLDSYIWSKRLLLVFASGPADPLFQQQMVSFEKQAAGAIERQLVVLPMAGGSSDANQLRSKFGVESSEFRVLLVGLDGGVKRDSRSPVSACGLFEQIDAMPMRREELKTADREASC